MRGAAELTALVGLEDCVRVIEGDVTKDLAAAESFDVVVEPRKPSCMPDKAGGAAEAFGCSDGAEGWASWIGSSTVLLAYEAETMWRGIAALDVCRAAESYRNLIRTVGFASAVPH